MSLTRLYFVDEPSDYSNYIISCDPARGGKLAIGEYPSVTEDRKTSHLDKLLSCGVDVWVSLVEDAEIEKFGDYRGYVTVERSNAKNKVKPKFLRCPIPDKSICRDSSLFEIIELVYYFIREGRFVYVHCSEGYDRSGIFASCFLMRYYDYDPETAIDRNKLMYLARTHHPYESIHQGQRQYSQIYRYRPPITIIVSGDRESANSFRSIIYRALKDLPPGSTVVHGACRGIDTIAGEIAADLNLNVVVYPILSEHWRQIGKAAGPIRNKEMVIRENPKYVLAFHPDVIHSKGTKDMMMAAYLQGIPVWLYDLKDKKLFEGDITKM